MPQRQMRGPAQRVQDTADLSTTTRNGQPGVAVQRDGRVLIDEMIDRFRGWHDPIARLLAATPPRSLLRHDIYSVQTELPIYARGRVGPARCAANVSTPDLGRPRHRYWRAPRHSVGRRESVDRGIPGS